MIMLVQSHTVFNEVAEFDPETGALEVFPRSIDERVEIRGHYAILSGVLVVLYRTGDGLNLRIGSTVLVGGELLSVTHARKVTDCRLSVTRSGVPPLEINYTVSLLDPPLALDPTPFVEDEDFDFGLFISNVLQSPTRRQQIYRSS